MLIKNSDNYKDYFTETYMMGPNCIRLADELLCKYTITDKQCIMDLGCGTGLSTFFLAKETNATIFAIDLWCSATDNYERFCKWNIENQVVPIHVDANNLPFSERYFDVIFSVDSYHYFALQPEFFTERILPHLDYDGIALIAVPGLKKEFSGDIPQVMLDWAGEDCASFHSCQWWKETIGQHPDIESVQVWEMENFDIAWEEWFSSNHMYAKRDENAFQQGIKGYLNFVGIAVKKRKL